MKIKVCIIENQETHFENICQLLQECGDDKFQVEIYPQDEEYNLITDLARIALDHRYEKDKSEKARLLLIDFLENTFPDILLVDFVLLGFSSRQQLPDPDGVKLVMDLWQQSPKLQVIPVLFLSSAQRNDPNVLSRLDEIENNAIVNCKFEWESKKPSGDIGPLGGLEYFDKYIIPKIKQLVNDTREVSEWKLFKEYAKKVLENAAPVGVDLHKNLDVEIKKFNGNLIISEQNQKFRQQFVKRNKAALESIETICLRLPSKTSARDQEIAEKLRSVIDI